MVTAPADERLRIASAEACLYRVPLPHEMNDATQNIATFEYLVVTLVTADGVRGTGWAYTTGTGGEAAFSLARQVLLPLLPGLSVAEARANWPRLYRALARGGYGMHAALALAAVDIATWDALGQCQRQPLYRLLGGARGIVPTYGSGVDLALSPDDLACSVRGLQRQGYGAFKVKVGQPDWQRDVARLRSARAALGPEATVFVDVNQGWTSAEAVQAAPLLRELGIGWLEEPFPMEDLAGYRRAAAHAGVPLAGGETLNSAAAFAPFVSEGLWDVLQPDVCRIGGITEWLRALAIAEVWNKRVTTHYVLELAAHLACVSTAVRYVEVTDHNLWHLGLTSGGFELGPGTITPTETPGHGVVFNEARLASHLVARA